MIKRIVSVLCVFMICFMLPSVCLASGYDPSRMCSLEISYSKEGISFEDLKIDIYRVAKLTDEGEYELLEPYSGYPIKIHGITSQQEWTETAQTIKSYVTAEHVSAYRSLKTGSDGKVFFTDLETGLYMVKGVTAENESGTFIFRDFMIYLPAPTESGYDYDMKAVPKSAYYTRPEKYTVVKLWNDGESADERPESVSVDILRNGEVDRSIVLDGTNDWSYSWEAEKSDDVWSVMEKDVPEGYEVLIVNNETSFIIKNTKQPDIPDEPGSPETGETAPLFMYVLTFCISGMGLIIVGLLRMKERHDEKEQ